MTIRPAAPGARDQVARLLTLVPYLHHRSEVRLADAAELLDTTPEQVLRDLRVLFLCGLPGGLPDDLIDVDLDALESDEGGAVTDGLIRIGNAGYLSRPLRLSATEASAVMVALHTLRSGSPPGTAEVVDRVLAKLESAVEGGQQGVAIAAGPGDAEAIALAAGLQRAADENRQVRLTYHTPARDELTERIVDPRGVVSGGRFSYLDAWCHSAGEDRLFRLDRIAHAEVLSEQARSPRRAPREIPERAFDPAGHEGVVATLLLSPEARWATDYYPVKEVRPRPDGSAEVDMVIADPRWLDRLLLRLAPGAEVLAPHEFTDSFTGVVRETLALYS